MSDSVEQRSPDTGEGWSALLRNRRDSVYLYQVWPGNNTPILKGTVLFGPNPGVWVITLAFTLLPSALFYSFAARMYHVSVIIIYSVFLISTLYNLCLATFTEPGILPRGPLSRKASDENTPSVEVDGRETKLRFCPTCHIWRPPRSKHCRDCDNCVTIFDHHCPWISNCVGERNHRFFMRFIFSATALAAIILVCIAYTWVEQSYNRNDALWGSLGLGAAAAFLGIAAICFSCCLCSLSCYNMNLLLQDRTTNEDITGGYGQPRRQRSTLQSLFHLLWATTPPSQIQLDGIASEDDLDHFCYKRYRKSGVEMEYRLPGLMEQDQSDLV